MLIRSHYDRAAPEQHQCMHRSKTKKRLLGLTDRAVDVRTTVSASVFKGCCPRCLTDSARNACVETPFQLPSCIAIVQKLPIEFICSLLLATHRYGFQFTLDILASITDRSEILELEVLRPLTREIVRRCSAFFDVYWIYLLEVPVGYWLNELLDPGRT